MHIFLFRLRSHLETIKALGLRPRAFICFSVFGTPDETLASHSFLIYYFKQSHVKLPQSTPTVILRTLPCLHKFFPLSPVA